MSYVIDYLPLILEGMKLTILVALLSLLISITLGMIGAVAKLSKSRIARSLAGAYTTIIRGMPELVLMMLIFFGGQILLNVMGEKLGLEYIDVSPFAAGVGTIGFIYGAYMAETFRGGILAVSRGEIEAGYAFGMTPFTVFWRRSDFRHRTARYGVQRPGGRRDNPKTIYLSLRRCIFVSAHYRCFRYRHKMAG
jgi:arginine/ornithine transport system permease protein